MTIEDINNSTKLCLFNNNWHFYNDNNNTVLKCSNQSTNWSKIDDCFLLPILKVPTYADEVHCDFKIKSSSSDILEVYYSYNHSTQSIPVLESFKKIDINLIASDNIYVVAADVMEVDRSNPYLCIAFRFISENSNQVGTIEISEIDAHTHSH